MKRLPIVFVLIALELIALTSAQNISENEEKFPYEISLRWRADIPYGSISSYSASANLETVAILVKDYPYKRLVLYYRGNLSYLFLKDIPASKIWVTGRGDYLLALLSNSTLVLLDENLRRVTYYGEAEETSKAIFSESGEFFVVYGGKRLLYYSIWKMLPIFKTGYVHSILRVDLTSRGDYMLVAGFDTRCGYCISKGLVHTKLVRPDGSVVTMCARFDTYCEGYLVHILGLQGKSARLLTKGGKTILLFLNESFGEITAIAFPRKFKDLNDFNNNARILKKGDIAVIAVKNSKGEWEPLKIDFTRCIVVRLGNLTALRGTYLDFSPEGFFYTCEKLKDRIVIRVYNISSGEEIAELDRGLLTPTEEVRDLKCSVDGRKILLVTSRAVEYYTLRKFAPSPEEEKVELILNIYGEEGGPANVTLELIDAETLKILSVKTINTSVYELEVPKKAYIIRASAEGFESVEFELNLTAINYTSVVVPIYFKRTKPEVLIRKVTVLVKDNRGNAVKGARIEAYYENKLAFLALSDNEGRALLVLYQGNYTLKVTKYGYTVYSDRLEVGERDLEVTVVLTKIPTEFHVSLYVYNYTGDLVKRFHLTIIDLETYNEVKNVRVIGGYTSFMLPKGMYLIKINATGAPPLNKTVTVLENCTLYFILYKHVEKTVAPQAFVTAFSALFSLMLIVTLMILLLLTNEKIALKMVKYRRVIALITICFTIGLLAVVVLPTTQSRESHKAKTVDIYFTLINGKTAKLSNYRGRILIVEFMSTECPTCEEVLSVLKKIYSKYRGFVEIVLISVDPRDTPEILENYAKQKEIEWTIGINTTVVSKDPYLSKIFAGTPTILILDSQGGVVKVLYGAVSYEHLEQALSEVIKTVEISLMSLLVSSFILGVLSNFSVCSFQQAVFLIGYLTGLEGTYKRTVAVAILYVLGIATMFVIFGILLIRIGALAQNKNLLLIAGGVITVLIGLRMLNIIKPPRSKLLGDIFRKFRGVEESTVKSLAGAYALGLAVGAGFAWTQCLGSFLPAVMYAISYGFTDIRYGILMPLAYTLGFSVVFMIIAIAIGLGKARLGKAREKKLELVEKIFSLLIVFFGIDMIVAGLLNTMTVFERIAQLFR